MDSFMDIYADHVNFNHLVQNLTCTKSAMFPDLKKNRHIFSFRNGIYFAHFDLFLPYGYSTTDLSEENKLKIANENVTSANYFDLDFITAYPSFRKG
jgi:hypothetical protein